MNKVLKRINALALLMLLFIPAFCQDIAASFNQYSKSVLQEKIFVHTDKNFYLAGEILWFKIYDVEATTHQPLAVNKVAYADVLDKDNISVLQAKIVMNEGTGSGSIYLPVNIQSGNYKVRAYTNWMKNFGADQFFEKNITVVNPLLAVPASAQVSSPAYDIQFFPEGGNMVNGITGKVAFRVVNKAGKGVDFKGTVINQRNETIASFAPVKFGIGNFTFTPQASDNYKAVIKVGSGNPVSVVLPAAVNQGYALQLTDNGAGQITLNVKSNSTDAEIYLFAHSGSVMDLAQAAQVNNGTASFTIDKSKLGEGISHLIVFNAQKQPVAERLYFKKPMQKLFIEAAADQQQYTTRKKVNVSIGTKGVGGRFEAADMSLSVYRIDSLETVDENNIDNFLWLTSDLKGNIESPEYYFAEDNSETNAALDNLMLTQGWSRFTWTDVTKTDVSTFKYLPEVKGLIVTGKLTNKNTGGIADGITAYMGVTGKRTQFYTTKSNADGDILFNTRDLYGSVEAVFTTNTLTDTIYRIDINSPFAEKYSSKPVPVWQVDTRLKNQFLNHSLSMQVQNIYNGATLKQFYSPSIDMLPFYGKPDKAYKLDDYTRFTTMEEVLREYIREVGVSHEKKKFHVNMLNQDRGYLDGGDPLVLFDGIPVFNMDKLMAIDPLKVNRIEAVAQKYYLGETTQAGILNLTSYTGNLPTYDIDPHALVMDYEGLQYKRQFFSPVYQTDGETASTKPDFRNLLYWSPEVYTDNKTKKNISFYTSDVAGTYMGVLNGITEDGKIAHATFKFEVK